MASQDQSQSADVFKQYFKYYKSKNEPVDLSDIVDFNSHESLKKHKATQVNIAIENSVEAERLGLLSPTDWKIYTLNELPGLVFVVNPFRGCGQQYWTKKCMFEYPKEPNVTNLHNNNDGVRGNDLSDEFRDYSNLFRNLRWATLGYHHNWDTKEYSEDSHTPFPSDLKHLTGFLAEVLNFKNFNAEAAIVNFYHSTSTLSGHTDHSEYDLTAPLFSISFGQPAIFLLGGRTKADKPVAMYLRSGDVVIMAGSVRLAYHAVPKILHEAATPWLCDLEMDETEAGKFMRAYLQTCRINVNVRQVFAYNSQF